MAVRQSSQQLEKKQFDVTGIQSPVASSMLLHILREVGMNILKYEGKRLAGMNDIV
jgi:hypothetical protein